MKTIIELAKEAGFTDYYPERLTRFAALVRAEALAEQFPDATKMVAKHKCGGCAKTAADGWALYCVECWEKAEPVKQEPVVEYALSAARQLLDYADDSDGCQYGTLSTSLVRDAMEQILPALYAAPADAKAIRAEAYQQGRDDMKEEAAKVCDETLRDHYAKQDRPAIEQTMLFAAIADCAAAIRGLK